MKAPVPGQFEMRVRAVEEVDTSHSLVRQFGVKPTLAIRVRMEGDDATLDVVIAADDMPRIGQRVLVTVTSVAPTQEDR